MRKAGVVSAKYVHPYLKGQKNEFRDAEAIAEAVQGPTMKFVATKTAWRCTGRTSGWSDRASPCFPFAGWV
jgi:transposase